jgi:hypothetical protein
MAIVKRFSLALVACLLILLVTEAWAKKPQVDPQVPSLRPMTQAQAEDLGAYVRGMRVRNPVGDEDVVAWSMINIACTYRAVAQQYAVVAAQTPFADPVTMESTEDLEALELHLLDLLYLAEFDAATINIAGPLVTEQVLVLPDGEILYDEPDLRYWPYHHGMVLNVEGEIKVLDLSIGDSPVDIDTWWQSFVAPDVTCVHAVEDDYQDTWSYWHSVYNSWQPTVRPKHECAYTLTPVFTWHWGDDMSVPSVADAPDSMLTQSDAFRTLLLRDHGLILPEEDIPHVLSLYEGKTVADMCEVIDLRICNTGGGKR